MVRVEGLRELLHATDQMGKETKKLVRDELRKAAEPVRDDAARRFAPIDVKSASKYGISVRKTGFVLVEQRLRKSPVQSRRRPKFGALQMRKALVPALISKEDEVVEHLEDALDKILRRWGSMG